MALGDVSEQFIDLEEETDCIEDSASAQTEDADTDLYLRVNGNRSRGVDPQEIASFDSLKQTYGCHSKDALERAAAVEAYHLSRPEQIQDVDARSVVLRMYYQAVLGVIPAQKREQLGIAIPDSLWGNN